MLVTRDKNSGTQLVDIVEAGQCLILTRILIGKLHEAYQLIQKRVSGDHDFRIRYGLNDEWAGKEQLELVNKCFNDSGALLGNIRDNLSFHSCDKAGHIESSFSALPNEEPWDFFLTDTAANSFYYASELVMTRSAVRIDRSETLSAVRTLQYCDDCRPSPQPSPHASAAHGEREQAYSLAKPFAANSSRYTAQR